MRQFEAGNFGLIVPGIALEFAQPRSIACPPR